MAMAVEDLLCRYRSGKFLRHLRGPGLGDRVASGLAAVGITKERVSAVFGDCGCEQRQQWLNEVGHRLGIGTPTPHTTGNPPPTPTG